MKLNKLVIAMGFATATLIGCGSSSVVEPTENINSITAIDGYIVNGDVIAKCGENEYTGVTDIYGTVKIDIVESLMADCSVKIVGNENTYDYDLGEGVAWKHTMRSLPGQSVINPYTDMAVTLAEDPTNAGKTDAELMAGVIELLGADAAAIVGDFDLFADFGTNSDSSAEAQKVRVLAESTFATIVDMIDSLGENDSVANRIAMFETILPTVTEAVAAAIVTAETDGVDLSGVIFTVDIEIPVLEFDADGNVDTEVIVVPPVTIEPAPKPTAPGVTPTPVVSPTPKPTGTGTGTGTGTDDVDQA